MTCHKLLLSFCLLWNNNVAAFTMRSIRNSVVDSTIRSSPRGQDASLVLLAHSEPQLTERPIALSLQILDQMRHRTSSRKLDVETDFYDASTGLHSEGVWHNCLVGLASLWSNEDFKFATAIANSLWKYSWDDISFRRRSYSGEWDHSETNVPEVQGPYYQASGEHRCIQHGIAVIFWSVLVQKLQEKDPTHAQLHEYAKQYGIISDSFISQFWDETAERWHTVSVLQGGGTVSRPSASMNQGRIPNKNDDAAANNDNDGTYYYRAVDQAVAVLACLGMLETTVVLEEEKDRIVSIIQQTCQGLLSTADHGFGYENCDTARSYIGMQRNRNFWHDGWVLLALVSARQYIWPDHSLHGETQLCKMLRQLLERYGHDNEEEILDGTIWHWAKSQKSNNENVRYCGDNALLYAIRQKLYPIPSETGSDSAFWEFVTKLSSQDGLVSVADVYPQVRLHPNTELAAFVLWNTSTL